MPKKKIEKEKEEKEKLEEELTKDSKKEKVEEVEEKEDVESKLKELEEKTKESIITKFDLVFVAKIFGILLVILAFLLLTKNVSFSLPFNQQSQTQQPKTNEWWNSSFLYRVKIETNQSSNVTYISFNFSKYSNFTKWDGIRFVGKEVYKWFNSTSFFKEYYLQPVYISLKPTKGLILIKLPTFKFYNFSPSKLEFVVNGSELEWWNATPFENYTFIFIKAKNPISNVTILWNKTTNKSTGTFEFFDDFDSLNRIFWNLPTLVTFENRKIVNPTNISIINSALYISSSFKQQYQFTGVSTRIPIKPPFFTCINFQILNSSSHDHAFEIVFSNQTKSSEGCFVGAFMGFFQNGLTTQYGCDSQRNEEMLTSFSKVDPFKQYTLCLNVSKKNYSILLFNENFSIAANKSIDFSFNNYGQIAFGSANGVWTDINQKIKVNWFFSDLNFSLPTIKITAKSKFFPNEKVGIFVNNKNEKSFYAYFSNLSLETYKKFNTAKVSSNYTIGEIERFSK